MKKILTILLVLALVGCSTPSEVVENDLEVEETPKTENDSELVDDVVKITLDNYQSLFNKATDYGLEQVGITYTLLEPVKDKQEPVFVEAFIPYNDNVEFSDDGTMVTSELEGISVSQTCVNATSAVEVVADAESQLLSVYEIVPDLCADVFYDETLDIAVKQTAYANDEGELYLCFLYSAYKPHGKYQLASITYSIDNLGDNYQKLAKELSVVFGFELPAFD